jgi:diguanylate cyclase (GGDEF)-like protein
MIERSGWEELKSQWPYLLTLAPLAAEWSQTHGLNTGWTGVAIQMILSLTTLILVVVIQAQRRALSESAITDRLTGLYNSRHLRAELDRQTAFSRRVGAPLSLIFLDVDDFKAVNDRHGHAAGDRVLRLLAQFLDGAVRQHVDMCFRFGGDEFLILCPHTGLAEAAAIAERISETPLRLPELRGERVTLSLSVIEFRPDETPRDLLERADRALYRAKQAGKNRVAR